MILKKVNFAAFAICLAFLSFDRLSAGLIGPMNTPGVTESYSLGNVDPFQVSETAWLVGSSATPKQFGFDPTAGYWLKNLETVSAVDPSSEQTLVEYVTNTGSVPWTVWTENLLTAGWTFDNTPLDTDDTWYSTDGGATKIPGTVSPDGKTVTFSFSTPIANGQQVVFHSEPLWGSPGVYQGTVQVAQAIPVVPEPSTLGLIAAAGVCLSGLFWYRRRV